MNLSTDTDRIKSLMTEFRYQDDTSWLSLPKWCKSYLSVGAQTASHPLTNTRLKVGLALPTIAFATTFVALGIVLQVTNQSTISEQYCEFIMSQPIGTPVVYQSQGRKYRGVIEGFSERVGKAYVTIRVGRCETRQITLPENAAKITIADREFSLRDYQQGSKGTEIPALVHACLADPAAFVTQTQMCCLVVAQKSALQNETENLVLSLKWQGHMVFGSAKELLRAEQFLGANQPYRSQIFPSSEDPDKSLPLELNNPPVVVFAGSNSYLRHHAKWTRSHQIVLLDRTERTFQDAVDSLNENYARRVETSTSEFLFDLPSGVDAIVLQEAVQ